MSAHVFFFFNDTATTEIYTLSLHDALPIYIAVVIHLRPKLLVGHHFFASIPNAGCNSIRLGLAYTRPRSEEHTSELQSRQYLVCRLLLEKKQTIFIFIYASLLHTVL